MITTVIFDMDDTLYDEIDYCKSGFRAVAARVADSCKTARREDIFDSLWSRFAAGNHDRTFNAALDELGVSYDLEFIAGLVEIYRNHHPAIKLPADSKEVLEELSEKYAMAMLTDGFMPAQQFKAEALGIEGFFQCIIYTEQLGREFWKPSPVGFEKIMQRLNVKPENCVYVADNEKKDFIAPNSLGMATIKLARPNNLHTKTSDDPCAGAKHVIDAIRKLPQLLEEIQS